MVTNPNTLGLWEHGIEDIAARAHAVGAYLYCDGADLNAIIGRARFGDIGFDVMHMNLQETVLTPHGGGGPGAGPVCCTEELASFLLAAGRRGGRGWFGLGGPPNTIGRLQHSTALPGSCSARTLTSARLA